MIHVWLVRQQGAFRVWTAQQQRWTTVDGWQALSTFVSHSAIGNRSHDKEVCLYIPTQMALTLSNDLSDSQLKQLGISGQQYLFEDLALTPVEQLRVRHISHGAKQYFYALGANDIEQWQQGAQLAGFNVTALLPDFTLLPSPDAKLGGEAVLYQDFQTLLMRYSAAHGVAMAYLSLLPKLLVNIEEIVVLTAEHSLNEPPVAAETNNNDYSDADADADTDRDRDRDADTDTDTDTDTDSEVGNERSHDVQGNDSNSNRNSIAINALHDLQNICDDNGIVLTPSTLTLMPLSTPNKHGLNFVETKRSRLASPYLTLAASVLLLAGVMQIAADGLQWYQYQQAVSTTKAAIDAQFSSWFADERINPRVNVVAQVQPRLLSGQVAQQTQINTLNKVAPIIKQSNLVAQSLRWSDSDIAMVLAATRREDLDSMQRTLSEQGIVANLGAINPTADGGVMGELTIPLTGSDTATPVNANNKVS